MESTVVNWHEWPEDAPDARERVLICVVWDDYYDIGFGRIYGNPGNIECIGSFCGDVDPTEHTFWIRLTELLPPTAQEVEYKNEQEKTIASI